MARLLCKSSMDFTASTWLTIDAATNSFSASEAASVASTTSYVQATTTTTPGAITIEGMLIRVKSRTGSGTFSVDLYNVTDSVVATGSEVTVNNSDIAQTLAGGAGGFIYFQFASPITLLAAKAYAPRIKSSVNASVTVYVSASNNWSRGLVTSTTAAPAASDNLYTSAPFITTTTPTAITLLIDNTSSTAFGSFENGPFCTVSCKNVAATNYRLSIANGGNVLNYHNATWDFSSVTSTSTFWLELQSASAANNGFMNRSPATFKMSGNPKTRIDTLAADSSAGATSLTTTTSTGWLNGDNLVFANTTRSGSPAIEKKALTANASGTTLTITAMTAAKSGTAPTKCHVGNVTSNVKISGTSAANSCFIINNAVELTSNQGTGTGLMILDNVEIDGVGTSTMYKPGISMFGANSTVINCGIHNCNSSASALFAFSQTDGYVCTGNVVYGGSYGFDLYGPTSQSSGTFQFNGNLCIGQSQIGIASGRAVVLNSNIQEVKNNIVSGCTTGLSFSANYAVDCFDGNTGYGCSSYGASFTGLLSTFKNTTAYLSNIGGILTNSVANTLTLDGVTAFSNLNAGYFSQGHIGTLTLKNFVLNGGVGATQPSGIYLGTNANKIVLENCTFGATTTHSSADINLVNVYGCPIIARDCTFSSPTILGNQTNLTPTNYIGMQRFGGTAGSHRTYFKYGRVDADSTIFDSSPRSMRLTPSSATLSQQVRVFSVNIPSGSTASISIKVRKSVAGDGAAYNGSAQPKIIMKANAGVASAFDNDITAMTATNAANGAWETLTYTTPTATDDTSVEFFLEAIGSAGWVNVDTIVVT